MQNESKKSWGRGVIARYREYLPVSQATPVVTLGEGSTPLIETPKLSDRIGARVFVKYEGLNPTGSFKDRGMTVAVSKALERGAQALICASTGNTSASRSEEHTSELQSRLHLVCRLLLGKKNFIKLFRSSFTRASLHRVSLGMR